MDPILALPEFMTLTIRVPWPARPPAKAAPQGPRAKRKAPARPPRSSAAKATKAHQADVADRKRNKPWTPAEVTEAFRRFQDANPEPRGELQHINPYTLLVAVVLSAQATDAGVNKATPALFAAADTPEKMVALGEAKVRDLIKTIGLYRTKAKNVIALSDSSSPSTTAWCRRCARRSRRCPASAARPPTWCSTSRSASRPSRSTPTSSASATAPASRPARTLRGRDESRAGGAGRVQAARPPLADPARPLHLRRAPPLCERCPLMQARVVVASSVLGQRRRLDARLRRSTVATAARPMSRARGRRAEVVRQADGSRCAVARAYGADRLTPSPSAIATNSGPDRARRAGAPGRPRRTSRHRGSCRGRGEARPQPCGCEPS